MKPKVQLEVTNNLPEKDQKVGLASQIFFLKKILGAIIDFGLGSVLYYFVNDYEIVTTIIFIVTLLFSYLFLLFSDYRGDDIFRIERIRENQSIEERDLIVRLINWLSKSKFFYKFSLLIEPMFFATLLRGNLKKHYGIPNIKVLLGFMFSSLVASLIAGLVGMALSNGARVVIHFVQSIF